VILALTLGELVNMFGFSTTLITITISSTIAYLTGMRAALLISLLRQEFGTTPFTFSHIITPRIRATYLMGHMPVDTQQLAGVTRLPGLHLLTNNPDGVFVERLVELYESSTGILFDNFTTGAQRDSFPDHRIDTIYCSADILLRHEILLL
jgi:hypothetical protein